MAKTVLWLDNDTAWAKPYETALKERGYEVTIIPTALEAEEGLKKKRFDLLILDVMIPTRSEEEERVYPPEITKGGATTGLLFYRRNKELLEQADRKNKRRFRTRRPFPNSAGG